MNENSLYYSEEGLEQFHKIFEILHKLDVFRRCRRVGYYWDPKWNHGMGREFRVAE